MYEPVVSPREQMMSTFSDCKIPFKSLKLGTLLHSGAHTAVYIANLRKPSGLWQEVVVKQVKKGAPEEESLRMLEEAAILRELNHQHVLTLVGVVDTSGRVCGVYTYLLPVYVVCVLVNRVHGVCTSYQSTWCVYLLSAGVCGVYLLPEYVVCVLVISWSTYGVCTCYQSTRCVLVTRVRGTRVRGVCICYISVM